MNDWSPKEAWFISVKEDGTVDRDWPGNTDRDTPQERLMGDGTRIVKVTPVTEARDAIQITHEAETREQRAIIPRQMGGEPPADTQDAVVVMFYLILRQMAKPGEIEHEVAEMEASLSGPWELTNSYLAGYAKNLVDRLYQLGNPTIRAQAEGYKRIIWPILRGEADDDPQKYLSTVKSICQEQSEKGA